MKNWSISLRMALSFGVLLLLQIGVATMGIVSNHDLSTDAQDITTRRMGLLNAATDMTVSLLQAARHTRNMLILDDDKIAAEVDNTRKQQASRGPRIAFMRAGVKMPEGIRLAAAVDERSAAYDGPEQIYLKMIEAGQKPEARTYLLSTMRPAQLELIKAVEAFAAYQRGRMSSASTDMAASASLARNVMIGLSLLSVAMAVAVGMALSRSIVRPIARAVVIAETVAQGDLRSDIVIDSKDETGRLLTALKAMNTNLANVVGQVRDSSESVATGSSQIASGNADLSQRTEEQASNLQQTAASMEQLNGTVRSGADTAREASQLASVASEVAARGGAVVSQVVGTMSDITASSKRIADIIGVIDGIAFQTNILALNAAVEAARAGEQGRGFAVVASEVRSLAQRSANAAKEIKGLINDSVEKVEHGSSLVTEAGKTMGDLVDQVQRVSAMINEISSAASEQTTGIGQVNEAVAQLDQATQQNAALVEESAAAADSLRQQSQRLMTVVSVFKTQRDHALA